MPLIPLHTDVTDALRKHYKAMAHAARDAEKRTFAVIVAEGRYWPHERHELRPLRPKVPRANGRPGGALGVDEAGGAGVRAERVGLCRLGDGNAAGMSLVCGDPCSTSSSGVFR